MSTRQYKPTLWRVGLAIFLFVETLLMAYLKLNYFFLISLILFNICMLTQVQETKYRRIMAEMDHIKELLEKRCND